MSDALKQAQQCLAVHSVNLRESKVHLRSDVDAWALDRSRTEAQSFRQVSRIQEVELRLEGGKESSWEYRFNYALGVRLLDEEADETDEGFVPDLEIVAVFQARYMCHRQLEKEELSAFAEDNVGYHVWPYWREFVQTSCNRVGLLSPIEIPMYSISRRVHE